jgi:hypothetical protein
VYSIEDAVQTFDFTEDFDSDRYSAMWAAWNALPVGGVIATSHPGEGDEVGTIYFEKDSDTAFAWRVVQVDQNLLDACAGDEVMEEISTVGYVERSDSAVIDAGGDLSVGYVIKEGP